MKAIKLHVELTGKHIHIHANQTTHSSCELPSAMVLKSFVAGDRCRWIFRIIFPGNCRIEFHKFPLQFLYYVVVLIFIHVIFIKTCHVQIIVLGTKWLIRQRAPIETIFLYSLSEIKRQIYISKFV